MSEVVKYIGERYVPIFYDNPDTGTPQWKSGVEYEPLTIVLNNGFSYTSKRHVPVGIDIFNTAYWVLTGQFDAQVQSLYELLQSTIDMLEQNTFGQDWNFYAFGWKESDTGTPDGEHYAVYKQTSDCNVVVNPDGKVLMIDSGWQLGNNNMQNEFISRGITRVDAVIISHFHLDHAGGFLDMENYLTFDENTVWYLPEKLTAIDSTESPQIYQLETQVLALIARTGGTIVRPTEGETFQFFGATLTFYNTVLDRWRDNETGKIAVYNDTSVVCMVQIGRKKVFYTGDAEYQLQAHLATIPALDGCDIMKFSHHGANRSYFEGFYYRLHPTATFATNGKDWTNTDVDETTQRTVLTMLYSFSGEFYMYNKMGVPVYATSNSEGYILHFTVNRKAYQFYTGLYNHSRSEPIGLLGCLYDTDAVISKEDISNWYRADPQFIEEHQYLQGRNIFQAPTVNGFSPVTMGKFLDSLPDNGIFMCRLTNTYNKMLIFDDGASIVIIHKTSSANFRNSYKDSPTAAVKSYVVMDYCTAVGSDPTQVDGRYGTNPICHRVVGNKLAEGGEWVFSSVPINGSNFIFFTHDFAANSTDVTVPVTRSKLQFQMNRDFGLTGANNLLYNIRTAVLFEVTCRGTVTGSCDIRVKIGDQNIGRIIHGSSGRDHVCNTFVAKPSSSGTSATLSIVGTCENAITDFQCLIKPLSYNYAPDSYLINEE